MPIAAAFRHFQVIRLFGCINGILGRIKVCYWRLWTSFSRSMLLMGVRRFDREVVLSPRIPYLLLSRQTPISYLSRRIRPPATGLSGCINGTYLATVATFRKQSECRRRLRVLDLSRRLPLSTARLSIAATGWDYAAFKPLDYLVVLRCVSGGCGHLSQAIWLYQTILRIGTSTPGVVDRQFCVFECRLIYRTAI